MLLCLNSRAGTRSGSPFPSRSTLIVSPSATPTTLPDQAQVGQGNDGRRSQIKQRIMVFVFGTRSSSLTPKSSLRKRFSLSICSEFSRLIISTILLVRSVYIFTPHLRFITDITSGGAIPHAMPSPVFAFEIIPCCRNSASPPSHFFAKSDPF